MAGENIKSSRCKFDAAVRSNTRIGSTFYQITLKVPKDAAEAFCNALPGQFVQLDVSAAALPPIEQIPEDLRDSAQRQVLLRRPFSISDITTCDEGVYIGILYCVIGAATLRMTSLVEGDVISVIGPLGNGFSFLQGKKTAVLVAGGMGAAPLLYMAKVLKQKTDLNVTAILGAKTKDEFPFELETFARYGVSSLIATDDGSIGAAGFVTDQLEHWLKQTKPGNDEIVIYSCGPEIMLAKVARIADEHKIDCQVSMERRMACGIGICQSCAIECKSDAGENIYKLCCKDGPVFQSREVVF